MSGLKTKYDALQEKAQALADEIRALPGPDTYGPEEAALIYAASRSQEVVFFLRDAAKAVGSPAPQLDAEPWTAGKLRHA
jgi:hypothetical protein